MENQPAALQTNSLEAHTQNKSRALFLDRDGVINIDHNYVHKIDQFEFIDGIFEVCKLASNIGLKIFVVTNQAGIGRGYYTEDEFNYLTEWMCEQFLKENIYITKVYYCPFHETHGIGNYKKPSNMRKPNPGMILKAIKEFDIDSKSSILIGDKESDIEAGLAAGIGKNILFTPKALDNRKTRAYATIDKLMDIATHLN